MASIDDLAAEMEAKDDEEEARARKLIAAAISRVSLDGVLFLLAGACDTLAQQAENVPLFADRDDLWAAADLLEDAALKIPQLKRMFSWQPQEPYDFKALLVA